MTFKEKLIELNACQDAREWVGDKSFPEAWATCERGDWMLWLANAVGHDKRQRVLAAGHCANLVRHIMTDVRSTNAVDVAILFGEGKATEEQLAADAAAFATAHAAYAAAYAAYAAAAADADAAYAATHVRFDTLKKCADICRRLIILSI